MPQDITPPIVLTSNDSFDLGPLKSGEYTLEIYNLTSGNLTVQRSDDTKTYFTTIQKPQAEGGGDMTLTTDAAYRITVGKRLRFVLAGATTPSVKIVLLPI